MMLSSPTTIGFLFLEKRCSQMSFKINLSFLSKALFENALIEKVTVFMEEKMRYERTVLVIGIISIIAPVYFFKTVYVIWFGPMDVFIGFQSERWTWVLLTIVDIVGFLSVLPARKNGRVIQVVMLLWILGMSLVSLATFVR